MGTLQYIPTGQAVALTGKLSDYITMNTLFGAVVVLAILFFIMLITYFVNIKPNLNHETTGKAFESSSTDHSVSKIGKEEELINDCELVAVITAAIYASLGDDVPADGLIVRSIRRAKSRV